MQRFYTQFAELHFVIGTWNPNPGACSAITYRLRMPGRRVLAACLPVIRTERNSISNGIPVAAVALDDKGERLGKDKVGVYAVLDGNKVSFEEKDGVWSTKLHGLKTGDYRVELFAEGAVGTSGFVDVRVTDGRFYSFDQGRNLLMKNGQTEGPLSGSFQGMAFFKDAGLQSEKMINGQKDWDSWDRAKPPGEHWHYWEGMTEAELDERFSYLAACGWNLLHVCQHFGNWMRLDAGGKISPHGAEQLALYLRLASRRGLSVLQALSHYPYGTPDSNDDNCSYPYSVYFNEGFQSEDWFRPGSRFDRMFEGYLSQYVRLFKEETAIFAMTGSGEGDWAAGVDRANHTARYVKSLDTNHLFLSEPILRMEKLPHKYYAGWEQEMFGSRVYWAGEDIYPELDLGVEFKFMQLGPVFMGEGSWPCPPAYLKHTKTGHYGGDAETWCGTPRYRNRVRDSVYLAMIHRIPVILTWDEQVAEDERVVFAKIREAVDWGQSFIRPVISIIVDDSCVTGGGRRNLARYEKAFASMPIGYRYVFPDSPEANGPGVLIDGRLDFAKPDFIRKGGVLPETLRDIMPVGISDGYQCGYLWSEDRRTLLAYIYNVTGHTEAKQALAGTYHRMPQPAGLKISLGGFPDEALEYIVYDLNDKMEAKRGPLFGSIELDLGCSNKDYFILVVPSQK